MFFETVSWNLMNGLSSAAGLRCSRISVRSFRDALHGDGIASKGLVRDA